MSSSEGWRSLMKLNRTMNDAQLAEVVFNEAIEREQLKVTFNELMDIRQILKNNPELPAFINNRAINKEQKKVIIQDIGDGFTNLTKELINKLYEFQFIGDLNAVINEFEQLYDEHNHTVVAKVTTVIRLTEEQREKIRAVFAEKIGAQRVIFREYIDPSIIGGIIIEANERTYDGSIRSDLENIKKKIVF